MYTQVQIRRDPDNDDIQSTNRETMTNKRLKSNKKEEVKARRRRRRTPPASRSKNAADETSILGPERKYGQDKLASIYSKQYYDVFCFLPAISFFFLLRLSFNFSHPKKSLDLIKILKSQAAFIISRTLHISESPGQCSFQFSFRIFFCSLLTVIPSPNRN